MPLPPLFNLAEEIAVLVSLDFAGPSLERGGGGEGPLFKLYHNGHDDDVESVQIRLPFSGEQRYIEQTGRPRSAAVEAGPVIDFIYFLDEPADLSASLSGDTCGAQQWRDAC